MERVIASTGRIAIALAAAALLSPAASRAVDLFSPGPLSRAHQALEGGLESCTRCHVAGEQLSQERCLGCHAELRARVAEGRGLHGRLPPAERQCWSCHHEHLGRDEPLVEWGKEGPRGFDHARTGFALRGKHRAVDCARCHDARRIADPVVKAMLEKRPGRRTFLGQPQACASCHFDEHRGQLGADCQRCHTEDGWKPARRFDHARAAFPLTGRHARVECARCHRSEAQPAAGVPSTVTPPVNAKAFLKLKGLAFAVCTDCHRDPHEGRFGASCTSCHTTEDWRRVSGKADERAFHRKTRFPLEGAHATVACAACHGPGPGGRPARFRGLAFARCTDCHLDAHVGQLATLARAEGGQTCEACHTVEAFQPARFEREDHARTGFPLDGAHRLVACVSCHPRDPALAARVPAAVRAELARRKRPVRVSLARFAPVANPSDCRPCHKDPHAGQFDRRVSAEGCTACHTTASFRAVKFDHAKDARFALAGKHAQAACASCHRPDAAGVVRYAPLAAACSACHADPHAGQFSAGRGKGTDCARCHGVDGWKDLKFVHAPPFTSFELAGKHRALECQKCHPAVAVAGTTVRKYRPREPRCAGCHEDFHRGAFRAFASPGAAPGDCAGCHGPQGWRPVAFDHARTGFTLEGRHREVTCKACHRTSSFADPVPRACAACHRDVHLGRLGQRCQDCHDPSSFQARTFGPDAHRRTSFPLTGRHAVIACEECHGDRRDRGFDRPSPRCAGCHEADLARASGGGASIDHGAPGFPTDCRRCHQTWRFRPASFPAHQACFDIRRGPHAGIRCLDCHTTLPPVDLSAPWTCTSDTANCLRCHGGVASEHDDVPGFTLVNRACYECHRFGVED